MIKKKAIEAVFSGSLKLGHKESCLIVTDTEREPIGRAFYEYARGITDQVKIVVIETLSEHGSEPPEDVAEIMKEYDVELLITGKSLTHTLCRREATLRGVRIASMPSITEDIANRCLDIDYVKLKKESRHVYEILKKVSKVRVTTSLGTDIVFRRGESKFFGKDGGSFDFAGAFGNLPEGEVAFSPSMSYGVYVVDASFPDLGLLSAPLRFEVKDGIVCKIEGSSSEKVIKRLDRAGSKAYRVAEFGIGLNPKAKITGNILEDEKVIGTVHIAVGNNLSFGGDNDVPLHLDGVITKPSVYVDGKEFMREGKFCAGQEF